jgi:putative membrane protein
VDTPSGGDRGPVMQQVPYCGSAPLPGELLSRFNWDPWLITVFVLLGVWHLSDHRVKGRIWLRRERAYSLAGWSVAAAALISPLCALSVALFSARVAQHTLLMLVAAPLVARGLPRVHTSLLWLSGGLFFGALWFWHMPVPYEATFASTWTYWAMHTTLFGSSILLWRALLGHPLRETAQVLVAGMLTFVHMSLLGAVFTLADRPLFVRHLEATQAWGLTPLQDQQLAGAIMWVPGIALFLWSALRSIVRLWESLDRARPA